MKKVVVTGGAGYIGNYVTRFLLEKGYRIHMVDSLLFGDRGMSDFKDHPNLTFEQGNVLNVADLARAFKDAYAVIHLAAVVGDPACRKNPDLTRMVNVQSTKIVVDLCNFYGVERLLFASSCSVYGVAPPGILLNEGSYLNPVSLYAESRILSEEIILSNARNIAAPIIFRLATAYGYSSRMRFDLAVNIMALKAATEGKVLVLGGGQYRPFVHCEDIARVFVAALEAPEDKVKREVFNVGSNEQNFNIKELGTIIADTLGVPVDVRPEREDERSYRVDFAKLNWLLEYKVRRQIPESVIEISKAIEAREFEDWRDDKYYNVRYHYML